MYSEFLWSKDQASKPARPPVAPARPEAAQSRRSAPEQQRAKADKPVQTFDERKQDTAEKRKRERAYKALKNRVAELEARIADREKAIKEVEAKMAVSDFYANHDASKPVLAQHQSLMWEVGELLSQWEMLQNEAEAFADLRNP